MRITEWKGLAGALVLTSAGLIMSACNTTKATLDTFAKFTSSTFPGEWVNADGVVTENQKARLFAAVVFENLEQDVARGNGEYVTSLAMLLKVPPGEHEEFKTRCQSSYSLLFAPGTRTAETMLSRLTARDKASEPIIRN